MNKFSNTSKALGFDIDHKYFENTEVNHFLDLLGHVAAALNKTRLRSCVGLRLVADELIIWQPNQDINLSFSCQETDEPWKKPLTLIRFLESSGPKLIKLKPNQRAVDSIEVPMHNDAFIVILKALMKAGEFKEPV